MFAFHIKCPFGQVVPEEKLIDHLSKSPRDTVLRVNTIKCDAITLKVLVYSTYVIFLLYLHHIGNPTHSLIFCFQGFAFERTNQGNSTHFVAMQNIRQ